MTATRVDSCGFRLSRAASAASQVAAHRRVFQAGTTLVRTFADSGRLLAWFGLAAGMLLVTKQHFYLCVFGCGGGGMTSSRWDRYAAADPTETKLR